ncbi:MAG: ATP-binding protein [archaeon]
MSSPGGLLRPLTVEKIQQHDYKPNSRNKIITKVLLRKGVMDERGSGILRMEDAMSKWGLEKPHYAEKDDYFVIEFKGPARAEKLPVEEVLRDLNDRQRRAVAYLRTNKLAPRDYRKLFDVSDKTARSDLKDMEKRGYVTFVGSSV